MLASERECHHTVAEDQCGAGCESKAHNALSKSDAESEIFKHLKLGKYFLTETSRKGRFFKK